MGDGGREALKSFEIWLAIIHATRSDRRRRLLTPLTLPRDDDSIH